MRERGGGAVEGRTTELHAFSVFFFEERVGVYGLGVEVF